MARSSANRSKNEPSLGPALPLASRLLAGLWAAVALLTICTFWQRLYPMVLVAPFRLQLTLTLLLLGLILIVTVRRPKAWVFVALPLVVGMTFLPYLRERGQRGEGSPVTMALVNVYSGNHDLGRVQAWVEQERPDVLALLEVTEAHRAQIESLPFAHKRIHPLASNFGLALLSQNPPLSVEVIDQDTPFPSLLASWEQYRILVTHPIPPISALARRVGDDQVQRLARDLATQSPPLIVMGDLNATGWDARLIPFLDGGLKESRLGHGILPTWPVGRAVMGIPIDHILIPRDWHALECRTGPDVGSDHFPLIAKIAPPASSALPKPQPSAEPTAQEL